MSHLTRLRHFLRCSWTGLIVGCGLLLIDLSASPQTSPSLRHRIYIGNIEHGGDSDLRKELSKELNKSKVLEVVGSPADADVTLAGQAELYIRGYYSLYVRAGTAPGHGHPLFGGYVSVELKSRSGETLWSYLSTLREATSNPARELSHDIAKHLLQTDIPTSRTQ